MGGLVIDIYLGFLVRWIVLAFRKVESAEWPVTAGTIVDCHYEQSGWGGDFVVLRYKYKANFERFEGEIRKPYIMDNYADAFVRHHPADDEIKVRVNPKDSTMSFPEIG